MTVIRARIVGKEEGEDQEQDTIQGLVKLNYKECIRNAENMEIHNIQPAESR